MYKIKENTEDILHWSYEDICDPKNFDKWYDFRLKQIIQKLPDPNDKEVNPVFIYHIVLPMSLIVNHGNRPPIRPSYIRVRFRKVFDLYSQRFYWIRES